MFPHLRVPHVVALGSNHAATTMLSVPTLTLILPRTSNISQSQKRRRVLLRFLRRICPRSFQPCPLQTQAVTVTGGSRPAEWAGLPRHGLILSVHVPQGQCCFWKCSFDGRTTSMIGVNSHKIISLVMLPFVPFLPLYLRPCPLATLQHKDCLAEYFCHECFIPVCVHCKVRAGCAHHGCVLQYTCEREVPC